MKEKKAIVRVYDVEIADLVKSGESFEVGSDVERNAALVCARWFKAGGVIKYGVTSRAFDGGFEIIVCKP